LCPFMHPTFSRALLSSFFFPHSATTEIYTLSLHDALPISAAALARARSPSLPPGAPLPGAVGFSLDVAGVSQRVSRRKRRTTLRSEEHTSELQSRENLVCRLLLEKKKKKENKTTVGRHETR